MKILIYVVAVLLPALLVGISNFVVFPDSSLTATIMLIVTVAASAIFTWKSGDATPKIARYCILADIAICAILSVNLGGHWILSREISAARQGLEERRAEEDREEQRRAADADRQLKLKEADVKLFAEERRRLRALPFEERRSVLSAPKPEPTKAPTVQQIALTSVGKSMAPRLTPDEVREKWWWFLTALAIAECAASVLASAVLAGIWEWDRNHDGIDDRLQRRQQQRQQNQDWIPEDIEVRPTGRFEGKGPRR